MMTHPGFPNSNNSEQWLKLFNAFKDEGLITISWEKDFSGKYITTNDSTVPVSYDGKQESVSVVIPAGDHFLSGLKVQPITIPGTISISSIYFNDIMPE